MIVDSAIYVEGQRTEGPESLRETHEAAHEQQGVAWIGLYGPTEEEFAAVAEEFGLHELAVEDALEAHQRPKIERYGQTLFVVLRPARYLAYFASVPSTGCALRAALHPYYDLAPTRILLCISSEFFVRKGLEYSSLPSTPSRPRWVTT